MKVRVARKCEAEMMMVAVGVKRCLVGTVVGDPRAGREDEVTNTPYWSRHVLPQLQNPACNFG